MAGTGRSKRRIQSAVALAVITGLTPFVTAYAQQRPGSAGGVTTRETLPSGIERVTNVLPDDPSPTWTLVEELRVGSVDGDGPDVFGELRGLVVLPDGGFAVLDSQAQESPRLRGRRLPPGHLRRRRRGSRRTPRRTRAHARSARSSLGHRSGQRPHVRVRPRRRVPGFLPLPLLVLRLQAGWEP